MAVYRYNILLDSIRLLKATLSSQWGDPFIMTNPRAIGARRALFRWDSLKDVNGYPIELPAPFADYQPFTSVQPILFQHLPEQFGREAFNHFCSVSEQRIEQIVGLFQPHGFEVAAEKPAWEKIGAWIYQHIDVSDCAGKKLSNQPTQQQIYALGAERLMAPVWQSICVDLSLLMAEKLRIGKPELNWIFWADSGISNAYQYGRSPWLVDKSTLIDGQAPERILLVDMINGMLQNALSKRLIGDELPPDIGLQALYEQSMA